MLKAGGHFHSRLTVPEDMRLSGQKSSVPGKLESKQRSVTWIVEIASQVLFSKGASVHYEILVGRDERSLDLGFASIAGKGYGGPGQLHDLLQAPTSDEDKKRLPQKGVYSGAVQLSVEDTDKLWNKPPLPTWDDIPKGKGDGQTAGQSAGTSNSKDHRPQKKIHLVVLTHGIHSNVGADMLYMKESIDATVRQAREAQRAKRGKNTDMKDTTAEQERTSRADANDEDPSSTAPLSGGQEEIQEDTAEEFDPDDEQVIVRGFSGNTTKTEKGIKYLGKRLAKYILMFTYPDQPFLPESKSLARKLSINKKTPLVGAASHHGSSIHESARRNEKLPYTFTSISFVGHSLGGLVQTYAVAYIQKHVPSFFQKVTPVNFICMASPMLGLSNENPLYVKFALDFGLVGRTGQDLGLTWRPPTIAKSGWASVLSSLGAGSGEDKPKQDDPGAKPLLRILPTGPAHQVLKMFRNRTTYSNVVNDGIVPLRTSCLLFLDWRGLDRVETARRENGLLATMASVGWAELTGSNAVSHKPMSSGSTDEDFLGDKAPPRPANDLLDDDVGPQDQPSAGPSKESSLSKPASDSALPKRSQFLSPAGADSVASPPVSTASDSSKTSLEGTPMTNASPFADVLNFFRPSPTNQAVVKPKLLSHKARKTYQRAQTLQQDRSKSTQPVAERNGQSEVQRPRATRGDSLIGAEDAEGPPPKTSVFDAAADILNPPIPTLSWLTDPESRERSIFHDRIYHPEDIPPPPPKKARNGRSFSADSLRRGSSSASMASQHSVESDVGSMKVEEKIARAYHHSLSWRKVLVRLEPDAHNNMIVRRMFGNAYGWEVVKHVCDTHFADTYAALTGDAMESSRERAKAPDEPVSKDGGEVNEEAAPSAGLSKTLDRTTSEHVESRDEVGDLTAPHASMNSSHTGRSAPRRASADAAQGSLDRADSAVWDDRIFEGSGSDDDSDDDAPPQGPLDAFKKLWHGDAKPGARKPHVAIDTHGAAAAAPSADTHIASFLTSSPTNAEALDADAAAAEIVQPTYEVGGVEALRASSASGSSKAGSLDRPGSGSSAVPGLRDAKTIPEAIEESAKRKRPGSSGGIGETVARAAQDGAGS